MRQPPRTLAPRRPWLLALALGIAWLTLTHIALAPKTSVQQALLVLAAAAAFNAILPFVVPPIWSRSLLVGIVRLGYWRPLTGPVLVLLGTATYLASARSPGILASLGIATLALALTQFGMLQGVAGR